MEYFGGQFLFWQIDFLKINEKVFTPHAREYAGQVLQKNICGSPLLSFELRGALKHLDPLST